MLSAATAARYLTVAMPIITLLTDFGTRESWVGAMKGVMLGICPSATLVDLTHDVPAQDVLVGALMLADAAPFFPRGTVHVAVVDPGVGSARAAIAVSTEAGTLVGPDNGLFTAVLDRFPARSCVRLADPRYHLHDVSSTFHGRDIFAPVAAHLAAGVPLAALGPAHRDLRTLAVPAARTARDGVHGEVLHVDRFGNLLVSVRAGDLPPTTEIVVRVGATVIRGLRRTFSDVAVGAPVAYVGSAGFLEIAVRDGDASAVLGVRRGAPVVVSAASPGRSGARRPPARRGGGTGTLPAPARRSTPRRSR